MRKSSLIWRDLEFAEALSPDTARAVFLGLAALARQPRLVLEVTGTDGAVSWRLGADDDVALRKALHVLRTHVPEVLVSLSQPVMPVEGDQVKLAATLRIASHRARPLRAGSGTEQLAVTRSLLATLAQAGTKEALRFQLVLGVRTWPRRLSTANGHKAPADEAAKLGQHGFGCCIRVLAISGSKERAGHLIGQVGAALRGLEAPGQAVRLVGCSPKSVTAVSSPFLWPLSLSVADLVPLGLPVADKPDTALPGLRPRHPRLLPANSAHPMTGGIYYGLATHAHERGREREIHQPVRDGLQHRHVLGPTGVGKSTLLAQQILQEIDAGLGQIVIDPKSELVSDLLARIPEHRLGDVVVLDSSSAQPVGFNSLGSVTAPAEADLVADQIVTVFSSLFGSGLGPRSSDLLHSAALSLARYHLKGGEASLALIPLLLTNPGLRRKVIAAVGPDDPLGLGAFWAEYEALSDEARTVVIRPLMNKLRTVLLRPSLRGIVGQLEPTFRIEQVFTEAKILLVRLGKDRIGQEAASLLGALIVADAWRAALTRLQVPAALRKQVGMVIDETQDYLRLPGSLDDALAQARSLGMSVTMAHQYRKQLGGLVAGVDANTGTKITFRLTGDDASTTANLFGDGVLDKHDFETLPKHQAYARLLVDGSTTPWVSLTTLGLAEPLRDPAELQRRSEATFGQPTGDTEVALARLAGSRSMTSRSDKGPERIGRSRNSRRSTASTSNEVAANETRKEDES
ncbi:type IV secretory system conjugative DNA transfer family protein [Flexivirga caeni]|uniref:ATP-binding protein n=1 Tax=Flexivirga caeni TaxID=2294115 RepID=A0A3M9M5B3_9MICO|nr:ATP-binding protein [Flexivirga caeni]RNI20722.1 ATP-binding protein [Flexivirga caeni]